MDVLLAGDYAPWVRACYVEKLRRHMGNYYGFYYPTNDLSALVRILGRLPEGPDIAAEQQQGVAFRLRDSSLSPADREDLNALLKLGEKGTAPKR